MRLKQAGKAKEYMARFKALRPSPGRLDRGGYSEKYDLAQMRKAAAILILDADAIYRNHNNEKRADLLLEWAMKLDRQNAIGYMKWQAIACQTKARHSQALALIEKVAQFEPDNADNQLAVGMFALRAGKHAKAEAAFRATIALAPNLADGYRELARIYNMRNAKPQEALDLCKAWGFKIKNMNGFVWNKLTKNHKPFFGMGFYTRAGSESALIAIRGKATNIVDNHGVRAVRSAVVGRHSAKPGEFRGDIVTMCGDVPRLEMFARESTQGWDAFGNEARNSIEIG